MGLCFLKLKGEIGLRGEADNRLWTENRRRGESLNIYSDPWHGHFDCGGHGQLKVVT